MREPLAVRTLGAGDPVLLVHGGVGPRSTWAAQEPLAARWRLLIPTRRGFAGSPQAERQDFDQDADDLEPLLAAERPHAVGFSYGAVGLAVAAGRAPENVRSLTLIEPPLFGVAPDHPDVAALAALSSNYIGGDAREEDVAAFERLAGVAGAADVPGDEIDEARRLARGLRPPTEADPDLAAVNAAGVPALVVSGNHHPGLEAVCDALAGRLAGHRERVEGARHAAQRAPGFNDVLERFLERAAR